MEELIINCQTKQETRRQFTAEEETARLAEMDEATKEHAKAYRSELRSALIRAKGDLKEIKELVKDGLMTQEEQDAHEALIDSLKAELLSLEK